VGTPLEQQPQKVLKTFEKTATTQNPTYKEM
jgi:hypothetical protein